MDGMQQNGSQQDEMQMYVHNTFWLKDQISITFAVKLPTGIDTLPGPGYITQHLNLHILEVNDRSGISDLGFTLGTFSEEDTQGRVERHSSTQGLSDKEAADNPGQFPPGIYLFAPPLLKDPSG